MFKIRLSGSVWLCSLTSKMSYYSTSVSQYIWLQFMQQHNICNFSVLLMNTRSCNVKHTYVRGRSVVATGVFPTNRCSEPMMPNFSQITFTGLNIPFHLTSVTWYESTWGAGRFPIHFQISKVKSVGILIIKTMLKLLKINTTT